MICIPGIFSGSGLKKGSIELNYYVTGNLCNKVTDRYADGRLVCVKGSGDVQKGTEVGLVLYNQGIVILNSGATLNDDIDDKFFSTTENSKPSWLSFGTGLRQAEGSRALSHGNVETSTYEINFSSVSKVPTLTMFAFSERGEHNFSNNPTFIEHFTPARPSPTNIKLKDDKRSLTAKNYMERELKVTSINKSDYVDDKQDHRSTTYLSKVGIYDKNKNLIAIASIANPIKKTEKRDFMIKMKIDF